MHIMLRNYHWKVTSDMFTNYNNYILTGAYSFIITKIIRSLNIFLRKTNDVIICPMLYIRPLLSRGHHQSERFLYSYNKILKVKKLRLFTIKKL